ncbi:ATP-binding protein [Saccharothrix sp. S26]|uniref:ATP-binding protein n=1 Tax=Saccharothrix sp. S26 TaxID=2907215 RepID=UPI001F358787|nr:ATP-binding protein [Saccharothrix sp. S26]MCE6995385.1 ATP-binding protein [Saccharothrix sp. S26]
MSAVEQVGPKAQGDGRGGERGRLVLSMDLRASRTPSPELRRWVRAALYREDEDCVEKVWLVLAELTADGHGWSPVEVRIWRSMAPSTVRIEVEDACREMPVPGISRWGGTRGFGLVLVDGLARRWGVDVHSAGRTVWADLG